MWVCCCRGDIPECPVLGTALCVSISVPECGVWAQMLITVVLANVHDYLKGSDQLSVPQAAGVIV